MYLFDTDDLCELITNEKIFPRFRLMERECQVLHMYLLKGFTFQFIAGVLGISKTMAHRIYKRSLKKMRKRIVELLEADE